MKSRLFKCLLLVLATIFVTLAFVSCNDDDDDDEIDKTVVQLPIDYDMTYCGMSLKNLSPLFDEQNSNPTDINAQVPSSFLLPYDFDNDGDINEDDFNGEFEITVNFGVKKHIDHVYLYYNGSGQTIVLEAGTPFAYETTVTYTADKQGWNKVEINADTQYLNIKFKNRASAPPYEIMAYGYDLGETPAQPTGTHQNRPMGYILGINGHSQADKASSLECAGYFRDYKTWNFAYKKELYPQPATNFIGNYQTMMEIIYKSLRKKNTDPVPCLMFNMSSSPAHIEGQSKNDPQSYVMYAEFVYQYSLRYGNNPNATLDLVKIAKGQKPVINTDLVDWIEIGNEPNGEDSNGYTPYQLAAFTSAVYDGHCNTMNSPSGSGLGIANADPGMKVAMSGLAGIQNRYIRAMCFWLEHNRADGDIGIDAFNVHTYCRKTIEYNGYAIEIGVSPEDADLAGALADVLDFRNTYYPDKEVWLTEFGWDTNQSYLTQGSSHAYGPYTGRQVQAMWLTRAYFILASIGVDRAAMYMCSDVGAEDTSIGKYGTSGIIASNGVKKDTYYYIYTLKSNMSDMYFTEIIDSGNEDVWIYKFENGQGKTCYAVWCPTSDNIRVDGYQLNIGNASSATLVEMAYGEIAGVSSALTVNNGTVSVNVSECPILVIAE